jgi:hypothetical protein
MKWEVAETATQKGGKGGEEGQQAVSMTGGRRQKEETTNQTIQLLQPFPLLLLMRLIIVLRALREVQLIFGLSFVPVILLRLRLPILEVCLLLSCVAIGALIG